MRWADASARDLLPLAGLLLMIWLGVGSAQAWALPLSSLTDHYLQIFSGHFAHATPGHALSNGIALVVLWFLVSETTGTKLLLLLSLAASLSVCLRIASPGVDDYLGLSGILHGLWAYAACTERGRLSVLLTASLAIKLVFDIGSKFCEPVFIGSAVILVEAHLIGAALGCGGAVLAREMWCIRRLDV